MARRPATPRRATARFYEPAGYCADESVGWLMKRALMSITQAADRASSPKGITHAQWAALFMLSARASTVAELARETQSDPGAMTRLLDRLEAKGFCRRQRSTDDRRVVRVELTPEGERRGARSADRPRAGDERVSRRLLEGRMGKAEVDAAANVSATPIRERERDVAASRPSRRRRSRPPRARREAARKEAR